MTASTSLQRLADGKAVDSFSNRMRSQRFRLFERLVADVPRPVRILDIGGTNAFWEQRGWADRADAEITLVNLFAEPQEHANIVSAVGDATNLAEYEDKSFDVAFSNSVIEHLFTADAQRAMAAEVQRVARAYWVQTPNFWFPMEPHFLFPAWHWLPLGLRVAIIRRRAVGWRGPCGDPAAARELVREIRLMRRRELEQLFPGSTVVSERWNGFTKSFVVHGGFPAGATARTLHHAVAALAA
jgi:hypothetical protein